MNRETRRHPSHPILPNIPSSKTRILDDLRTNSKSSSSPKKTRKNPRSKKH